MHQTAQELVSRLEPLVQIDRLTELDFDAIPAVIHDDHRYTLAVCSAAQGLGRLNDPCDLVIFDYHTDFSDISYIWKKKLEQQQPKMTSQEVIQLCMAASPTNDTGPSHMDDNWIKAGMELGLIRNVISFGAFECPRPYKQLYRDVGGQVHTAWFLGWPSQELVGQGKLHDETRRADLEEMWNYLGWDPGQQFVATKRFLLSIDLDCFAFAITNGDFFAWPERAFASEFLKAGAISKRFLHDLAGRAGVVNIVREPTHCGSIGDSEIILQRLDAYAFDGELTADL